VPPARFTRWLRGAVKGQTTSCNQRPFVCQRRLVFNECLNSVISLLNALLCSKAGGGCVCVPPGFSIPVVRVPLILRDVNVGPDHLRCPFCALCKAYSLIDITPAPFSLLHNRLIKVHKVGRDQSPHDCHTNKQEVRVPSFCDGGGVGILQILEGLKPPPFLRPRQWKRAPSPWLYESGLLNRAKWRALLPCF
jgi:hypothetical protein